MKKLKMSGMGGKVFTKDDLEKMSQEGMQNEVGINFN